MRRKSYSNEFKLQRIEEFKRKIESNKYYCKCILDICDEINVIYETFKKWFKIFEKISLNQFCQKCKFKYAKYLLLNTNDKIYNIAYKLGYKNEKKFTACFKKYFLMTPQEFK